MIVQWHKRPNSLTVRRFRVDALFISLFGLAGAVFLVRLLALGKTDFSIVFIPLLLAMACLFFGFHTLRTEAVEHVHLDLGKKRLLVYRKGRVAHQLPLQSLEMVYSTGEIFKTLLAKHKQEHIVLFQSFFFSGRLFQIAALMGKSGVPLGAVLRKKIQERAARVWRMVIVLLLFASALVVVFVLLEKNF